MNVPYILAQPDTTGGRNIKVLVFKFSYVGLFNYSRTRKQIQCHLVTFLLSWHCNEGWKAVVSRFLTASQHFSDADWS